MRIYEKSVSFANPKNGKNSANRRERGNHRDFLLKNNCFYNLFLSEP